MDYRMNRFEIKDHKTQHHFSIIVTEKKIGDFIMNLDKIVGHYSYSLHNLNDMGSTLLKKGDYSSLEAYYSDEFKPVIHNIYKHGVI